MSVAFYIFITVLDLLFYSPLIFLWWLFDEHDNEDEFYGYINDNEIERITKHNKYDYDDDSLDNNNMTVADGLVLAGLFLLLVINYGCVCMC